MITGIPGNIITIGDIVCEPYKAVIPRICYPAAAIKRIHGYRFRSRESADPSQHRGAIGIIFHAHNLISPFIGNPYRAACDINAYRNWII